MKRSVSSDQVQARFNKRAQTQDGPSVPNNKFEKRGGSHNDKLTCSTCGKNHYGECLVGMGNYFVCGKYGHKVRDCPNIASTNEGKKVHPSVPKEDAPTRRRFYALRTRGEKLDERHDYIGKSLFLLL